MDGPRDYHPKQSQTEKGKYQMIQLICGILKKNDRNELKNRLTDTENKLMVTKGEREGCIN